jgi:hypothetical protein
MVMRIDLTLAQIHGLKLNFADQFDEDERGWLDALEGETDAFELVRRLLDRLEREEGDRASLTEQMETRKHRRDRCDARIKAQRETIVAIMDCAGVDKLPLPEATLSLRTMPAKLSVNDNAAVPDEYTVSVPKPDLDKIKAAFAPDAPALPNWLRVDPERPSLTIRRK